MKDETIKKAVREGYAKIAKSGNSCCFSANASQANSCSAVDVGTRIGYSGEELRAVPKGAISLGCGNPVALASLREGETVLDLGSGAGFDCFLAAGKVGKDGRVIGVDMTPEMIERARENSKRGNYGNVEFRLGEIENLPAADNSVDVVMSNCVINLSADKSRVFREVFRVLKHGGRFVISDVVLLKELPDDIKNSPDAYVGCISGAMRKEDYLEVIKNAGFKNVKIKKETRFPVELINDPTIKPIIENLNVPIEKMKEIANSALSITVQGIKPKETISRKRG